MPKPPKTRFTICSTIDTIIPDEFIYEKLDEIVMIITE